MNENYVSIYIPSCGSKPVRLKNTNKQLFCEIGEPAYPPLTIHTTTVLTHQEIHKEIVKLWIKRFIWWTNIPFYSWNLIGFCRSSNVLHNMRMNLIGSRTAHQENILELPFTTTDVW